MNRKRENLTNDGVGITARRLSRDGLIDWMQVIADRFRNVRVCCGDWARITGPTPTVKQGTTAMFLDPPYAIQANRQSDLYRVDDELVAGDVRRYCLERGGDKMMRIALCGYQGEGHEVLENEGWSVLAWKSRGGFASQSQQHDNPNARKERIWFSPGCIAIDTPTQQTLWSDR